MTYQLGGTVEASDYNTLIVEVNRLFNTGEGDFGYGGNSINVPISNLPELVLGDVIDNQQWLDLRNALMDCADHQGTTLIDAMPSVTDIEDGDPVEFFSTLSSAANLLALSTYRFNVNPSFIPSVVPALIDTRTLSWGSFIQHTFTITFEDSDHARYFFNTGGSFTIDASRTGGTVSTHNTAWSLILGTLGPFTFTHEHYYALTSSNQELRPFDLGPYNASIGNYSTNTFWTIFGKRDDAAGPNGGNGSVIRITSSFLDNNVYAPDVVDGTFTSSITESKYTDVFNVASPTYATVVHLSNGL